MSIYLYAYKDAMRQLAILRAWVEKENEFAYFSLSLSLSLSHAYA